MTTEYFAAVQALPYLGLPLSLWFAWLGWRGKWRTCLYSALAVILLAALFCFGPFIADPPESHGGKFDALGAILYFGIFLGEMIGAATLGVVLGVLRTRAKAKNQD